MPAIIFIGVLILSYIIGSIPFGLLIVRLKTGKDVRSVESGRTGGTNVMRAAGLTSGIATAILDMLKAFLCVFIARYAIPGNVWLEVLAPVAAVFGHNNSIFLLERDENGRLKIRGGAGGASSV
jgi:glycerol-3-phosphate acyltransferase PlsY